MSLLEHNWPTAVDYTGAAQDPEHCFVDPRLQRAEFQLNRMGMPVVRSGQMAAVLPARIDGNRCAIRLFTTPVDHAARYRAIAAHLAQRSDVPLVPAEWISNAVAVGDGVYPAVLMPWVDGVLLSTHVDDLVEEGRGAELRTLAAQWVYLVGSLRAASVVHGDLQHGNVMVGADGALRLIDYDGIWVPGMPSDLVEAGMANYQHPQRLEVPQVLAETDTFAAFVIYVSLLAIAADPDLWDRFHGGENLIFVREDFLEAGRRGSPIWADLAASPDPDVSRHAETLSLLCSTDLRTIPTLHDLVIQGSTTLAGSSRYVPDRAGGRAGGNWWDDAAEAGGGPSEAVPVEDGGRPWNVGTEPAPAPTGPGPTGGVDPGVTSNPGSPNAVAMRIAIALLVIALLLAVVAGLIVLTGGS